MTTNAGGVSAPQLITKINEQQKRKYEFMEA